MRVVDTHYHGYPPAFLAPLDESGGYPRAGRTGDGYRYYNNKGRPAMDLPPDQAMPVARECNERPAGTQRRYPGRFHGTARIPRNDTARAPVMPEETEELG
jgi:hypothetical protein